MQRQKIAIVGTGVVGTALAYLLKQKGYPLVGLADIKKEALQRAIAFVKEEVRSTTAPEEITPAADIVFITTGDSAIQEACEGIAGKKGFHVGQIVVHTSGSLPSTILESARSGGALIASCHPLQSFADAQAAITLIPASIFNVEGDPEAIAVLSGLVQAVGGRPLTIATSGKPIYHAAAVVACNFFVTLVYLSYQLFEEIGIHEADAAQALLPLIKGTVNNIEQLGPIKALTGPIARGDVAVIKGHLEAMKGLDPRFTDIYRTISRLTVEIGIKKGTLSAEKGKEILQVVGG
jgi:predicted short-subunit dehydrogenase-like oxidoreductase (DUF2520 family)